eukprot:Opistho-2@37086
MPSTPATAASAIVAGVLSRTASKTDATPQRKTRKRNRATPNKGTEAYERLRNSNNVSVSKCRQKKRFEQRLIAEAYSKLEAENARLRKMIEDLATERRIQGDIYASLTGHVVPSVL